MFPTFDVPPQHAETVGARKNRKAAEEDAVRRSSTSTGSSTGTSIAKSDKKSGGLFGWGRNKNKEIQEIVTQPTKKPEPEPIRVPQHSEDVDLTPDTNSVPSPSVAPSDWSAALALPQYHHPEAHHRRPASSRRPVPVEDKSPPQYPTRQQSIPASIQSAPSVISQSSLAPSPIEQSPYSQGIIPQQRSGPPSRSLPTLPPGGPPPTGAVPPPPSSIASGSEYGGRGYGVGRMRSQMSHVSLQSASTERTAFSNRSVFSTTSGYDSVGSRESTYSEPRYGQNLQLEPVESRSSSRAGDRGTAAGKAASQQTPFGRALAKMESAGPRIVTARLSEEWEGLDDDESFQEVVFEKRLWALTAYQRLTQNKQIQSPAHEILSASRPADQRRILHLHGTLADGWMLAARYPSATVYTTSSLTSFATPSAYPAPLNHHSLYVPSLTTAMPFPDGYFDAIVSRSVSTVLRNEEWARTFFDCRRVLKAGGQIDILSVDPHMSSEGRRLGSWIEENIDDKLEARGLSRMPSDTILDTLEIVGMENIRRARVALPAYLGAPKAASRSSAGSAPGSAPQDAVDASRMMAYLGRHFYSDLYGKSVQGTPGGENWFWTRRDIQDECERHQTKMVMTIACALKPAGPTHGDSYLDI